MPNACGTGGGAKNWYDHIFLSQWIVNNTDHIKYIPNSYHTIGNDGQRLRISINNSNVHVNTSAPADVIEALYQMSNKYPVMLALAVTPNTTGISPADPEITGVTVFVKNEVTVTNPVGDKLMLHFPAGMKGQEIDIECFDGNNTSQMKKTVTVSDTYMQVKCNLQPGVYTLKRFPGHHNIIL